MVVNRGSRIKELNRYDGYLNTQYKGENDVALPKCNDVAADFALSVGNDRRPRA